jgi:hypothetical protein
VAPAAFIKGSPIQATVTFTVMLAAITQITIAASNLGMYGDIQATTLNVARGIASGTVITSAAAADQSVDVNNVTFNWSLSSVTVGARPAIPLLGGIRSTTNRIYTLYAAPVGAMATPWATVLELAIGIVKQSAMSPFVSPGRSIRTGKMQRCPVRSGRN